ncbi:peptidoglycan DD-metalloendopeptidase family protein [Frigidibacter sp. RF13]|uniref:peptidoglycan DD-metalloendopeptidase family protein n=1 Tax=Frigidibacter sp. RF13 TaxID=2997340 RepID=UPI0022701FEA|nr:peptidoglycan DD-metalloendopeptidase family protein [Frigidibacter sp. RF13]MCY1125857.1 peptidoglycan DD-metalloendopeptidase family protein [Frigidibacter sp. RF13]
MTGKLNRTFARTLLIGGSLLALAACESDGRFDGDLRHFGQGIFDTSDAARNAGAARPTPDPRGIISYPGYQVAVARQGDTVASVAARIGMDPNELANYNALQPTSTLRANEVLALPRRVADATMVNEPGGVDVTTIAGGAIDRATGGQSGTVPASAPTGTVTTTPLTPAKPVPAPVQTGAEPIRHKVERGESAYSIARLYNVNVKALADWNGLGKDLAVREGQILLIPVGAKGGVVVTDDTSKPGEGSKTPTPPSAAEPVPEEKTEPASKPVEKPAAPDVGATTASAKLSMPVQGSIIRGYQKKKNDGIDISASAGTAVGAAGDGTVAAITKDTEGVPILVIRHAGNLLTVYANIDGIAVKKGDKVKRGQAIAKVRGSNPAFLHFEVRQGFESVDPMPYLQ